jgi:Pentapeptide repeats (8 copies)
VPCPNLGADFRCGIHARLRDLGFPGCEVFDCFGAGQQLTQVTFGGRTWRDDPALAAAQFAVLPVLRQLHESLWYLTEALDLTVGALHDEVRTTLARTEGLAGASSEELGALDIVAHRRTVGNLLGRISDLVRGGAADHRSADLMGRDLRTTDLRGASLRGAYLIGADLRGVDLGSTDLLGADLRAADVRGADLSRCLFLTQPQVTAARGDVSTRLPVAVTTPPHWR